MTGITPAPPYDPGAEQPPPALPHAEWGDRVGAAVIDLGVRLGIVVACMAIGALGFVGGEDAGALGIVVGLVVGAAVGSLAYAPVMIARTGGQTVGHRVTKTRIVNADGSALGGGGAFVREVLVKALLIETIGSVTFYVLPAVNYLFPLWDAKHETLHDKLCRTRVVPA